MAEATSPGIDRGQYASALFDDFVRRIERHASDARILDLGPSTPENLMFWIDRDRSVSALNLTRRTPDVRPELDYPDDSVGGIVCWTVLSHVSKDVAGRLVEEFRRILIPGGAVFAIFDGDGRRPPSPLRYKILSPGRLSFEPVSGVTAPRPVATREIEDLFSPFQTSRIMVMRHGSREALAVG